MTIRMCPPQQRNSRPLVRVLAFCMILCLLAARLGSLTEEVFVTPIEAAIFAVAFISDADKNQQSTLLLNKAKCQLECGLPQSRVPVQALLPTVAVKPEHTPAFSPRELAADIFIPPEAVA